MPRQRQYESAADRQAAYRKRSRETRLNPFKAKGLPAIAGLPAAPGAHRWRKMITAAQALLGTAEQEMNVYYDERSESWQESDKGETFQERLDALNEVHEQVGSLLEDW